MYSKPFVTRRINIVDKKEKIIEIVYLPFRWSSHELEDTQYPELVSHL
jgi:hypothetical protein